MAPLALRVMRAGGAQRAMEAPLAPLARMAAGGELTEDDLQILLVVLVNSCSPKVQGQESRRPRRRSLWDRPESVNLYGSKPVAGSAWGARRTRAGTQCVVGEWYGGLVVAAQHR